MLSTRFIIIFYTLLIVGVLVYSGLGRNPELHDRYIVRSDGPIFLCKSIERSLQFYREILDLPASLAPALKSPTFKTLTLPDKSSLYLSEDSKLVAGPSSYILKVRNNFKKLHAELLQRERQLPFNSSNSRFIGEIKKLPEGEVFVVKDLDQNQLFFYKRKKSFGEKLVSKN